MPEFIFQMQDLRKVVPPKREILKGIWLSFYEGAKIGVLGHNGAGKSTLLRIMAGQDKDFSGEAFLHQGYALTPGVVEGGIIDGHRTPPPVCTCGDALHRWHRIAGM